MQISNNSLNIKILLICLVSLIIGLIYIVSVPNKELVSDAISYDELGWSLSRDKGFVTEDGEPCIRREPFYPFFLSLIYRVWGHNIFSVQLVQVFLLSVLSFIIFLVGKELFSPKVALGAGVLVAIYPALKVYASFILTEIIFTFLLAVLCFFIVRALKTQHLKYFVAAGLFSGLCCLTRGVMLLFPLFMLVVFLLSKGRNILRGAFVYFILTILVIAPWTVRNYLTFKSFIPVSLRGGEALWIGSYMPFKGEFRGFEPYKDIIKDLDQVEADRTLRKKAFEQILRDPLGYLKICARKALLLWKDPVGKTVLSRYNIYLANILTFFYYAVAFFACLGLIFLFKGGPKVERLVPALFILYFTFIHSLIVSAPRFHLPLMPFVFALAVFGLNISFDCLK